MIKIFKSRLFRRDDEKKMEMISPNQSLKEESKTKPSFKVFKKNKLLKIFLRNKVHPTEECKKFKYEPSDAREVEESLDSGMKDSSTQNTYQQEKKNKKINFWKFFHCGNRTNKEKKNKNVEIKFYGNIYENFIKNDDIIIGNANFIESDGTKTFNKENFIENDRTDIIDNDLSFDSFYSSLDEIYMDSITYLSQIDSFDLFEKEKDFEFIHDINVESLNIENINQSSSYTFSDSDDELVSDFVNDDVLNSTFQLASLVKEIRNNSKSIINAIDKNNNLLQCEINKKEILQSKINKKKVLECENNKKELLQFVSDFVNDVVLNSTLKLASLVKEIRNNSTSIINTTDTNNDLLQCEISKKDLLQCEINKKDLLHCEIIKKNKSLQTMHEFALCELDEDLNETEFALCELNEDLNETEFALCELDEDLNETEFEIKVKDCCSTINMFENVAAQQETI